MLIGYARVSTYEQNLDLQKNTLKASGCEKIYEDKISGARAERPGLTRALEDLRPEDCLVVWKLDRLGRSLKHLISFVEELAARQVHFKSLTDNIDTSTPGGRFFFHIMASLAQMERELIIERTRAGLKAAREKGRIFGRRRLLNDSKMEAAKKLLTAGVPGKEVAANLGVSISTLYRWIPAAESLRDESAPGSNNENGGE
jgi:DNA invertase Pin-like site-specific DNA recombinase